MTADRLIRFYPRAWRDRYGAEFLEMIGTDALHAQQVIDIAMGAVDAWLSADVRHSAASPSIATNSGGRAMVGTLKTTCGDTTMRFTSRDMWISGAVLGCGAIAFSILGSAVRLSGHPVLGDVVTQMALPVSVCASLPFGVMKGQPWRAQAVVLGVVFAVVVGARYLVGLI